MHTTTRLGLQVPDGIDNESSYPTVSSQQMSTLDNAAIYEEGSLAARPAANAVAHGTLYRSTDASDLSWSDGTNWNSLSGGPPIGAVQEYAGSADPAGGAWILANGRALNRTTYSALFTALGTTYGAGDGSTTFNIPDMRGRFPLGKATAGTGSSLGTSGGSLDHTHSVPGLGVPGLSVPGLSFGAFVPHSHGLNGTGCAALNFLSAQSGNLFVAEYAYQGFGWTANFNMDVALGLPSGDHGLVSGVSGSASDTLAVQLVGNTNSASPFVSGTTGGGTTGGGTTGGGTTGSNNPAYMTLNYIIKIL